MPLGQFAQLVGRHPRVLERLGHQRRGLLTSLLKRTLDMFQRDQGVHEPLLRSVVQVADQAAALLVARDENPRSRHRQIRPRLHVGDRPTNDGRPRPERPLMAMCASL